MTEFIFSSNYPTHLKFELDEDSGIDVLEVATHRASLGGWIDTCHDLGWVRKGPLQLVSNKH